MFNLILFLAFTAAVVSIATHAVVVYRSAEGTIWQRTLATSRDSATWLLAKVTFIAGLAIEGVAAAAEYFNRPDVTAFQRTKVPAEYVAYVFLAIAILTFAARARSLFR